MDKSKRERIRMVQAQAALAAGDAGAALAAIKPVAARWPHSRLVWSAFAKCDEAPSFAEALVLSEDSCVGCGAGAL